MNQKALRAGCASREEEVSCKQHRSSEKESQATRYFVIILFLMEKLLEIRRIII